MFARNLATLSLCILPAFAAPSPPVKVRRSTDPIRGRYIVTLKEGANRQNHIDSCRNVTHEWDRLVNGFAGFLNDDEVNTLSLHPEVHSIEEDGVVRAQSTTTQYVPSILRLSGGIHKSTQARCNLGPRTSQLPDSTHQSRLLRSQIQLQIR